MDLENDETLEGIFNQAIEEKDGNEKEQNTSNEDESNTDTSSTENEENTTETKEGDDTPIEEDTSTDTMDADIDEDPALIIQKYKTLQGMFKKQKEQLTEFETELKKLKEESATTDTTTSTDTNVTSNQQTKEDNQSDDITSWISDTLNNNDSIKSFSEDFPDVKEFMETALKEVFKKYQMAEQVAFKTLYDQIEEKINPLSKTFTEQQKIMQIAQIEKEHPDFDTIVDNPDFSAWIGSQPERLRDAYNTILEEGTAEEVIYLLNEYKSKNNLLKPKVVPKSKNTAVSPKSPISKDDFEAAFNEALKE